MELIKDEMNKVEKEISCKTNSELNIIYSDPFTNLPNKGSVFSHQTFAIYLGFQQKVCVFSKEDLLNKP